MYVCHYLSSGRFIPNAQTSKVNRWHPSQSMKTGTVTQAGEVLPIKTAVVGLPSQKKSPLLSYCEQSLLYFWFHVYKNISNLIRLSPLENWESLGNYIKCLLWDTRHKSLRTIKPRFRQRKLWEEGYVCGTILLWGLGHHEILSFVNWIKLVINLSCLRPETLVYFDQIKDFNKP